MYEYDENNKHNSLLFKDKALEKEYWSSTAQRRIKGIRYGSMFSLLVLAMLMFLVFSRHSDSPSLLIILIFSIAGFIPISLLTIFATYRRGWAMMANYLAAGVNLITGFLAVYLVGIVMVDFSVLIRIMFLILFYGHLVQNYLYLIGLIATIPYTLAALIVNFSQPATIDHDPLLVAAYLVTAWICSNLGGLYIDRRFREAFILQQRLKGANEQLQKKNQRDFLTGLLSRSYFIDVAHRALQRSLRYGDPIVLAMVDLDHFKKVNDRLGHPCGDRVLNDFARIMLKSFRKSDLCARYGGEEFILLLEHTTLDDVEKSLERFRKDVQAHAFEGVEWSITCSIGATVYTPEDTLEVIISRADTLLYQAKRSGRNKVVASDKAEFEEKHKRD